MSQERIERALEYPYPIPEDSYVVADGTATPVSLDAMADYRDGRTAVLAVGSNQSPQQIARKYQGAEWGAIPCEKCRLDDFDTVFSAHIAAYGSIAAALHPSRGTRVSLFVNWLTDKQLDRMHETELGHGNYVFARMDDIYLKTSNGLTLDSVHFYRGNGGAYAPTGIPVPLGEVRAVNRVWPSQLQNQIQATVHQATDAHITFDQFIISSIEDTQQRHARRDAMRRTAIPFEHHALTVIRETLG